MAEFDIGVKPAHDPYEMRVRDAESPTSTAVHPLDTEQSRKREALLRQWWHEAFTGAIENRMDQAIDTDFYDGLQWNTEDAQILKERGQAPLVFNVIQQHIRWIMGTERRTRVQYKVYGRTKEDLKPAQIKTQLLKYTDDVNRAAYARSKAFEDLLKAGVGWLETGIRGDPYDEPLFDRWESWRNMWNDPLAREPDNSDARFVFRSKWVDEEIAIAMFPDRVMQIRESARETHLTGYEDDLDGFQDIYGRTGTLVTTSRGAYDTGQGLGSGQLGNVRSRVRLIECWYRMPQRQRMLRTFPSPMQSSGFYQELQKLNGQELPQGPVPQELQDIVLAGHASVYDAVRMKVRVAIFCAKALLSDQASPYRHDKFPFTPIWAFKRDRDNQPYGPIRNMRDPQEDLNKRRSKALFILSTNKVVADDDATEDWDEVEEQVSLPNGIIKKRRGSEFEIHNDTSLAREHVALMEQDRQFLEQSSGVTEENRGEVTNAISGTAINLRQTQGSVVTADLFDNLRFALQIHGEKKLSLIEQYYSEPKRIRIATPKGKTEFLDINNPVEGEQGLQVENDITASKADFVIDTTDFRESMRQSMFTTLMHLMGQLDPQIQLQLMDLVVDLSDAPNREEMVRRIREINGAIDPDAEDAREQIEARNQAKTERQELERREKEAEIGTKESRTAKTYSDASRAEGETMAKAAEISELLANNPGMAAAIDELFASFQDAGVQQPPQGR